MKTNSCRFYPFWMFKLSHRPIQETSFAWTWWTESIFIFLQWQILLWAICTRSKGGSKALDISLINKAIIFSLFWSCLAVLQETRLPQSGAQLLEWPIRHTWQLFLSLIADPWPLRFGKTLDTPDGPVDFPCIEWEGQLLCRTSAKR